MMHTLKSRMPRWIVGPLRKLRRVLNRSKYAGAGRQCSICGFEAKAFVAFGVQSRPDAMCPNCESKERDRFAWLYLEEKTNLFDGKPKRFLHVAPERCFEPRFRERLGDAYITADFNRTDVTVKMDIQNIQFEDDAFDVIYCSHVLEHVDDDRKAMREFHRVLKPGGWAILLVPITDPVTFEDPSITDPAKRLKVFGQHDHVRRYGPDYRDRLVEAGFKVDHVRPADMLSDEEITRLGVRHSSAEIFYCTK